MHLALAMFATQMGDSTGGGMLGGGFLLFFLGIAVLCIAGFWKMFVKAGEPGWAAIIPIYNAIVILRMVGKPLWWVILLILPFVSIIIWILISLELARRFGKDVGFAVGLILLAPIFVCILGFGSATYTPPPRPAA